MHLPQKCSSMYMKMLWLGRALCWSPWWPGNTTDAPLGAGNPKLWVSVPDQHCNSCCWEEFGRAPKSTPSSALPAAVLPSRAHWTLFHTLQMLRFIPLSLTIKHSFRAAGAAVGWNVQPKPAPLDWLPGVLGQHQPKTLPLGLPKANWCWLETTCCSKGEGKHFCSSSSDFFLFRMAAPSLPHACKFCVYFFLV